MEARYLTACTFIGDAQELNSKCNFILKLLALLDSDSFRSPKLAYFMKVLHSGLHFVLV